MGERLKGNEEEGTIVGSEGLSNAAFDERAMTAGTFTGNENEPSGITNTQAVEQAKNIGAIQQNTSEIAAGVQSDRETSDKLLSAVERGNSEQIAVAKQQVEGTRNEAEKTQES